MPLMVPCSGVEIAVDINNYIVVRAASWNLGPVYLRSFGCISA